MKILALSLITLFLINTNTALAEDRMVNSNVDTETEENAQIVEFDPREDKLRKYLESHKSPLSPYASDFIKQADAYNLDWRLVAAISGVESTFGKRIPYGSYNAYGWANGEYKFQSWPDSIEHVSKTLRQKYYDRGADTIDKIARRYAPPSQTWGRNVKFFMEKIDPTPIEFDL